MMRKSVLLAAAALASFAAIPSASLANNPEEDGGPNYVIEVCSETECSVYECNDYGCSFLYSHPRQDDVKDPPP